MKEIFEKIKVMLKESTVSGVTKESKYLFREQKEIIELIENNPDIVKFIDNEGNTILHEAIKKTYPDVDNGIVLTLLKYGADLNKANNFGYTPFMDVALSDNIDLAKILLEYGANIHMTNKDEENVLLIAARLGTYYTVLNNFIEMGVDTFATNKNGATLMHLIFADIIDKGILDLAKSLIEQGHDINAVDNDGNTIWHYYAGIQPRNIDIDFSIHELTQQLLLANIDVDKKNNQGISPLVMSLTDSSKLEHTYFIIASGAIIPRDEEFKWPNEYEFEDRIQKVAKICDKIYTLQSVDINDSQLFEHDLNTDPEEELTDHRLIELRLKNLALKKGMPAGLDQHINKFVHFSSESNPNGQAIKQDLIQKVKMMVKTKEEVDLMIEPVLASALHSYNPEKFPLAPYKTLKNIDNKMQDVPSTKDYDVNFQPKNSLDYILNPNNRDKIYPILLADDENRKELLGMIKSLILYKPDHRLREAFINDCKILEENAVRFLYKRSIAAEAEISKSSENETKRGLEEQGGYVDQILQQKEKRQKNQGIDIS